ncbi:hypothetical protein [Vibrio owensii]|uniref:hypothetical protein n=1 Tax=Vibrio harveyi group TaxID=717610 RepID=UPI003CC58F06
MTTLQVNSISQFENFRDTIVTDAVKKHLSLNLKNPNVKNELASALLGFPEYHKLANALSSKRQWWQKVVEQKFISPMEWMALYGPTGEQAAEHIYLSEPDSVHQEYMSNMDRLMNGDEVTFDWFPAGHGSQGDGELNPCFSYSFGEFQGAGLDLWFSIGMATYGCDVDAVIIGYLSEEVVVVNDKEVPVPGDASMEDRLLIALLALSEKDPLRVLIDDSRKYESSKMMSEISRVSKLLHKAV